MTTFYRVYRRNATSPRAPRDFMGRVQASSEAEAVSNWLRLSGSKILATRLEAVACHSKRPPLAGK